MARILVLGAGGAASNGFLRSLRASARGDYLIGTNASPTDLLLSDVDERHLVPPAGSPEFANALFWLIATAEPDFVHAQSDEEVRRISELRHVIRGGGARYFLPSHQTVVACQDKWASYLRWRDAGVPVPETQLIERPADVDRAFSEIGEPLWLRETHGAAGSGAIRTGKRDLAVQWIESREGWGRFTAARALTSESVTWQSIWQDGELVVAQTRRRHRWAYSRHTPTGVTGITGVGETWSDDGVTEIAERAVRAVDDRPHGIFGVDMVFDEARTPHPTEINIGRFFTTHEFFTRAGLNLPEILVALALDGRRPDLPRIVNPLPDRLLWVRGMDVEPVLTSVDEVEELARTSESWRELARLRERGAGIPGA